MSGSGFVARLLRPWHNDAWRTFSDHDQGAPLCSPGWVAHGAPETQEMTAMPRGHAEGGDPELARFESIFRETYNSRKAELEAKHFGDYVVINVKTGKSVIGSTPRAAMEIAAKEFGSTDYCWSRRIGAL